ncbi:uncharacterized protein LOC132636635 [Lycium barbarum]|uniref:uncharacterized protein LOC132636635 n=1 Tax=Lycium barbarum TaxID=112863 RepID=UPI00293F0F44|nr:uncharacterized protein LOC132636635 [Lycium barbarum]
MCAQGFSNLQGRLAAHKSLCARRHGKFSRAKVEEASLKSARSCFGERIKVYNDEEEKNKKGEEHQDEYEEGEDEEHEDEGEEGEDKEEKVKNEKGAHKKES